MENEFVSFPQILSKAVDAANERLGILQDVLHKEIMESSLEIMGLLQLDPKEGWKVDLEEKRFVLTNADSSDILADGTKISGALEEDSE
jgi:hypothetical protein